MPSEIRLKRIQDQIRRVLTEILESKVSDPRVDTAYITDVDVDRELDFANVYVSSLAGEDMAKEILQGLEHASGFIRYTLSQEINLRVMPKLRFYWDETPDRADRIEALLDVMREERSARLEDSLSDEKPVSEDGDEESS